MTAGNSDFGNKGTVGTQGQQESMEDRRGEKIEQRCKSC